MIAPSCVPLGPRSCGCRSWTSCAPAARSGMARLRRRGARSRNRRGCRPAGSPGRASRSARERKRGPGRGGTMTPLRGGQLWGWPAVLLGHYDPGGQVVPVEQLVFAAQQVVLAVSPGRFGVGAIAGSARGGGREEDSRSVQSTASEVLASLNSAGMLASSRSSQTRCSSPDGSPPGSSLLRALTTRLKVRSVCR